MTTTKTRGSKVRRRKRKAAAPEADPHAEREARRYDQPIASREYLMRYLAHRGAPLTLEEIAAALGLESERDREALGRRLRAMERDGQLIRNRRGGYGLVEKMDLVHGRVAGHPEGYGFLITDEPGTDLFLSPREMRAVMHGDRVVARVKEVDARGRREAAIVEVLERNTDRVVGRFHREAGIGRVVPDNRNISQDILIASDQDGSATGGEFVVAEILEPPTKRSQPIGRIIEILGDDLTPGLDIEVAVHAHGLPAEWPDTCLAEADRLGDRVPETAKQGRTDLRNLPLVTIDGDDAKDFDDAVYCERRRRGGWRVVVAIADVSAYVEPGSPLDAEAHRRGNSVYFPARVIPMLPEALSNGLCSLNPHEDRLCMGCELTVNKEGGVTRSRFFEGVMRSSARLTYDEVAAAIEDGRTGARKDLGDLVPQLETLYEVFHALQHARRQRGAIDFDTTETRILFKDDYTIDRIEPMQRKDAHRVIEECMIAANVAAARFLLRGKMPALYRVHEGPDDEKVAEVRRFLGELGLRLRGGSKPEPHHFAELLERIRAREDAHLIQTVLLRSLKQAIYSPDNIGHFGLAHDAYTHFTSPIRRYPDLLVHRAIRHKLRGGGREDFDYQHQQLSGIGEHCSMAERRADEATRDVITRLKCEYMRDKVGEVFAGTITGVTSFGLFVELDQSFAQGLVHVTALSNDYYHFDPAAHRLRGERTGRVYQLADRMRVKVVRVDVEDRKIDFEPVDEEAHASKRKRGGRRRQRR